MAARKGHGSQSGQRFFFFPFRPFPLDFNKAYNLLSLSFALQKKKRLRLKRYEGLGGFLLTTSQLIVYRGNPRVGCYFLSHFSINKIINANEEQDIFCGSSEKGRLECRSDVVS